MSVSKPPELRAPPAKPARLPLPSTLFGVPIFYGWYIVALAFVAAAMSSGISAYALGIFVEYLAVRGKLLGTQDFHGLDVDAGENAEREGNYRNQVSVHVFSSREKWVCYAKPQSPVIPLLYTKLISGKNSRILIFFVRATPSL